MAQHVKDELNFSPAKKLAGERNADSVLFNVAELETVEREAAKSSSTLTLSTKIETTGSGLIDLRKLVDGKPDDGAPHAGKLVAPQGSTLLVPPPSEASEPAPEPEPDEPARPSMLPTVLVLAGGLIVLGAAIAIVVAFG